MSFILLPLAGSHQLFKHGAEQACHLPMDVGLSLFSLGRQSCDVAELRNYQNNAITRASASGSFLLKMCVGFGVS